MIGSSVECPHGREVGQCWQCGDWLDSKLADVDDEDDPDDDRCPFCGCDGDEPCGCEDTLDLITIGDTTQERIPQEHDNAAYRRSIDG